MARPRARRLSAGGLATLLALAAGCVQAPVRPMLASCAAPCGAIHQVDYPDRVQVLVHVLPSTRLHNATLTTKGKPACASGLPVVEVTVQPVSRSGSGGRSGSADNYDPDGPHEHGPVALSPTSNLNLRFPLTNDGDAPPAPVAPPLVVDLDVHTPAGNRCLRLPLPDPGTGWMSLIRELSLRLEPRPDP